MVPAAAPREACRRDRQVRGRVRRRAALLNETVDALNWLGGYKEPAATSTGGSYAYPLGAPGVSSGLLHDTMVGEVLTRLDGLISNREPTSVAPPPTPQAALRKLLQGRCAYDARMGPVSLAPFKLDLLSLPEDTASCPTLEQLLPPDAYSYLEGYHERMLEVPDVFAQREPVVEFMDASMRFNQKQYHRLVKKLAQISLIGFTCSPLERIGVFAVWKSGKTRQRLIVDARRANQHFRAPPGVSLVSSEGLGKIEVELPEYVDVDTLFGQALLHDTQVYLGAADVKDCFHRMRMPPWLRRYFCLPAVPASVVGMAGQQLEDKVLGPRDPVWPCWAVLPMGFTWSLYFAQRANEAGSLSARELLSGTPLADRGPPLVIEAGRSDWEQHYVYVDNLGLLTGSAARADSAVDDWARGFGDKGLPLHKSEVVSGKVTTLGTELDGERLMASTTLTRVLFLRQAIVGMLQRRKVPGWALEVLVGHCAFVDLSNRALLSVLHTVYRYMQANYDTPSAPARGEAGAEDLRCAALAYAVGVVAPVEPNGVPERR